MPETSVIRDVEFGLYMSTGKTDEEESVSNATGGTERSDNSSGSGRVDEEAGGGDVEEAGGGDVEEAGGDVEEAGGGDGRRRKKLRGLRKKRFERRVFAIIMIALVVVIITAPAMFYLGEGGGLDDPSEIGTKLFYEGACLSCAEYVRENYVPMLKDNDVPPIDRGNLDGDGARWIREERHLFRKHYKVPSTFQQPIEVFVVTEHNVTVIFIGDAPPNIVSSLLSEENLTRISNSTGKILFYQEDYLDPDQDSYYLWGFKGAPREYPHGTSISQYLDYFEETGRDEPVPQEYRYKEETEIDWALFLVVTISAFLDGINPCAIAILIFFISFLYSAKGTRSRVVMMGSIYILAIYTIYFLIGLGLFTVLSSFGAAFYITMIGAVVVMVLGVISMRDYLFPRFPFTVEVPYSVRGRITSLIEGATLPTTLLIGLLIGAYTFPCSGAIYVVIISLVSVKASFLMGLVYLLWYNLWFVMPLIAILAIASNRKISERLKEWEYEKSKKLRAFSGLVMIGLGVFIIVWYVLVGI